MKYFLSLLLLSILIPATANAYTAYVHSIKATVYKSPSMRSAKLTTLSKGAKLDVKKTKGAWFKVKTNNNRTGWVYKFMVKKNPISDTGRLYSRLKSFFYKIDSITKKSRRRPSSYTSTAAARGLREKRRHFAEKYNSDYDALEFIEAIVISDEEAMEFLWKGVQNEKGI